MSRFLDGPAAGVHLDHARAPAYLRVVQAGQAWDVLDQVDDQPRRGEVVHVYELVPGSRIGPIHVCRRGRGARSGWISSGDYRHRPDVDGETVRETAAWRAWATAQPEIRS